MFIIPGIEDIHKAEFFVSQFDTSYNYCYSIQRSGGIGIGVEGAVMDTRQGATNV